MNDKVNTKFKDDFLISKTVKTVIEKLKGVNKPISDLSEKELEDMVVTIKDDVYG